MSIEVRQEEDTICAVRPPTIGNWRDLGGKVTSDGSHRTKTNCIFRCATLDLVTVKDVNTLIGPKLNIRTIVDLRKGPEGQVQPKDGGQGAKLLEAKFPIAPEDVSLAAIDMERESTATKEVTAQKVLTNGSHERARFRLNYFNKDVRKETKASVGNCNFCRCIISICYSCCFIKLCHVLACICSPFSTARRCCLKCSGRCHFRLTHILNDRMGGMSSMYYSICKNNPSAVKKGLDLCADPTRQPVVFHCTSGKDRTGITAALLLHSVGIPKETIVEDYFVSHSFALSAEFAVSIAGAFKPEELVGVNVEDPHETPLGATRAR